MKAGQQGKRKYTSEDERTIKDYYDRYGEKSFEMLSEILYPKRQPRSIREHFEDFLKDGLNHEEFTEDEDMNLIKYVTIYGKKWRRISLHLQCRSCGMLKNRYQVLEKKIKSNEIAFNGKRRETYFFRKKNLHSISKNTIQSDTKTQTELDDFDFDFDFSLPLCGSTENNFFEENNDENIYNFESY